MNPDLSGQLAVVTGAGRGIGRGCAEALAEAGAELIAIARSQSDLDEVAGHASGRIKTWAADVCSDETYSRIEALERVDLLVNNAGTNHPQGFAEVGAESLHAVLDLNVRAAFRVAQSAVRVMLARKIKGSVINMSSQMGHVGSPGRTVYCMTKHAIEGLTKAMAVELAPEGIRVNAVAPTFIKTSMTRPMLKQEGFRDYVTG